jgi:hypothetical protein
MEKKYHLNIILFEIQNTTSKFNGVSWRTDCKKWRGDLNYNRKQYYGGYFDNEEHAAMKVNLLCDEHGIIRKNLTIDAKPDVIQKVIYTLSIVHETTNTLLHIEKSTLKVLSLACRTKQKC